ncbi:MAG: UDP-N-acetylmuramoyl-tripeptide--D-alanyl-D-alanine ligase [Leptospiraceae bacterium]|nr:UDP-N-acetylmuramoyl-tripeptide--D-alanyl-D-alanine ligase [Leptospiraceae bacterium]
MVARCSYDLFTVASVLRAEPSLLLPNIKISSITNSSLEVKPGALFIPLKDKRDGHDFIHDALARGAAAFLAEKGHRVLDSLSAENRNRAVVVNDTLRALADLAAFHRRRFAPFVVAVTGSNGKTTTKEMLSQIFRHALGNAAMGTEKNYNNHIGVPFTLLAIKSQTRVAVVEMGMNHRGEIHNLSAMAQPTHAVITSIGHAHIEFLGTRQNIARAKAEILDGMPAGGTLYIPADIAELPILEKSVAARKIHLRRINPQQNAPFRIVSFGARGVKLRFGRHEANFPYAIPAWLSNLALATAVAQDLGLPVESIAQAVQHFRPPPGRMQLHRGYFTVIDDGYNANPDSAIASLKAALVLAEGKPVVCVFGDFKELGRASRSLHAWTGREAAQLGVAAFYGVGEAMRDAVREFQKQRGGNAWHFDRNDAESLLQHLAEQPRGSVILVKGSRAMQMEEIAQRLYQIRDKVSARKRAPSRG